MLRELNTTEMKMVSGGSVDDPINPFSDQVNGDMDEVSVIGVRINTTSPTISLGAFGSGALGSAAFLNSFSNNEMEVYRTSLIAQVTQQLYNQDMLQQRDVELEMVREAYNNIDPDNPNVWNILPPGFVNNSGVIERVPAGN